MTVNEAAVANILRGQSTDPASKFGIVVARFNESITTKLLDGALRTLEDAGISDTNVDVCWVPGAWEIPIVAHKLAVSRRYAAVICLGAVIRGETTHDKYINLQVSVTLGRIAVETSIPILFGLLTCQTMEQAMHRAGGDMGHKGVDCAQAALEMVSLLAQLD
jgi:6,7-dimethyl-8-ribityllumazine synthase